MKKASGKAQIRSISGLMREFVTPQGSFFDGNVRPHELISASLAPVEEGTEVVYDVLLIDWSLQGCGNYTIDNLFSTKKFRDNAPVFLLANAFEHARVAFGVDDDAALRLTISEGTLANWVAAARHVTPAKAAPGSHSVPELEAEVTKLRKELA